MKARITEDCIACGLCVQIYPEVFKMGDQFAQVKMGNIPDQYHQATMQAADECPVSAIIIEK